MKAVLRYSLLKKLDGPVTVPIKYERGREVYVQSFFEISVGCTMDWIVCTGNW